MFNRMTPQNLAVVSLLADSGNGEVQNPVTDLPLVNGQDDPISSANRLLHWDAEWHWDATYSQYPHQALGGHIVTLGLSSAQQLWDEYTYPVLDWAHQHNGIAGFAHLQYLDGTGLPSSLTCCTPIEYPVEVALGAADFISEDVDDVYGAGSNMYSESPIQAYYKLLNSGFRPSFAAGTDYPCNGADNGGALGNLLTYVQVAGGQLSYRNWINGIAKGRTVVSRNGHDEFLGLTVNGTATPGDEVQLPGSGSVTVTVQWTAAENLNGTIELVQNGVVVQSLVTSAGPDAPAILSTPVNFAKSGWLAARRMGNAQGNYEHFVHTSAVFVTVNNAPIRASAADAQYYVDWMNGLLQNTSPGGDWNWYFPTSLSEAQARYQSALALYQQIAAEAAGSAPTLTSIALSPIAKTIGTGTFQQFTATGTYSNGTTLNMTGQVRWASSNLTVAPISGRGLASALNPGTTNISASLSGITGSTALTVSLNPLAISTQSLAGGTVGALYSASLAASGGTLPYTWSISSGLLPTGLSLNSSTGNISGTPTAAGTFTFTVQATDASSPQQTATQSLSIVIISVGGGPCPCTIWPSTALPGIADSGPDSAVEVGVTFRADLNGYITGIRFYKGVGNTGTHVANLWTNSGLLLGTATFVGESPSGWQQVNFATPVAISANALYIASYHTNVGHYSDDQNYFAGQGVDNAPLHAPADGVSGPNGVYAYGSSSSFPNQSWNSSNYWVDVVFAPGNSTTPPTVTSVTPVANSSGASLGASVTAVFSEPINASTINGNTFVLLDSLNNQIPANVTYNAANLTATLKATVELNPLSTYSATVSGGVNGVQDVYGNALANDFIWSFTTVAAPPNQGPGGPILVISNAANPFTRYYSEILATEGLNEYTVADASTVTPAVLANFDVAILGEMSLTGAQATMLSDWVTGGGRLIAMRPDKQLSGLLGLALGTATLSDAYLQVQTTSGPGAGIVGQTMQFHGSADLYTLSGASSLATLYSDASTSTGAPAVTLVSAGAGQAAAFTYDLARSIVYTRQGDPAWSGEARDGQPGPLRSDDLFFGAASFDPQPDWVDLNKVAIPQADEQQRLLANLVLQMNRPNKPLPRFWYFPSGFKAVVVMTGDDHGSFYSGTATDQRFQDFIADSPGGCSVADWQCVRATSYLFPQDLAQNSLTDSQAASYVAQGFEISVHGDSVPTCSNWTTSSLDSFYSDELASFASQFPSVPAPQTHRMHCISWSDYDSQPQVELKYGIRLDTSYYYWPPTWVNDQPGMFTGSGMPMRYSDRNGNIINVYQATTQMTDESGQTFPFNIDTLLDNALGTTGYYGAFVANMHNDQGTYPGPGANEIVASAQSRGVPVVSSLQMLTWLDGRNSSSFGSISWTGNTLSFTITSGTGARNLQAMLPLSSISGTLTSIKLNGNAVAFSTQTIKGIAYAVFPGAAGPYQAVYGSGSGTATLSAISVNPGSVLGGTASTGTVTLSGPAPTGGATITLSSSNTAAAQTPPTVAVSSNQTSATFSITTSSVTVDTNVAITGSLGTTQTTTLTVTAPATTLTFLTLNPSSVLGGTSSTGTVTLSAPAATGGAVVTLASDSSAAQVPANVTVAAESTTGTFTVTTSAVSSSTLANISANYGTTQSAALTVTPATVLSVTLNPTSVLGGTSSTGTVTLNGNAPAGGAVVTLASDKTTAAQVPTSVTVAAGNTSATFTVTTSPVSTSTQANISANYGTTQSAALTVTPATVSTLTLNPTSVQGGNSSTGTVTLSGNAPAGGAVVALASDKTTAAQVPASVTVAVGSTTGTFTVTTSPVSTSTQANIAATYGTTQSAALTVTPATVSTVTLNPTSVQGGDSSTGTVTLNGNAPAGGAVVALASDKASAAQVPANVTVAAGSTTGTFTVATSPVSTSTLANISATYGTTQSAALTVTPPTIASVTLNPAGVLGGNSSTGTVTLNGDAPAGGAVVTLASDKTSAAQVSASVTVAAGSTTATFTVTTSPVTTSTLANISGTYGGTVSAGLTVNPPTLASVTLSPTSVLGGTSSTATVTLNGNAPAGGAVVALASDKTTVAQVPASVTVAAGATTANFNVTTNPVATNTSASISGTYGVGQAATLMVTAASLSGLSLNPTSVVGGTNSTGTVTLNGAAPTGGAVVTLASNNNAAQVPANVTVAGGAMTADFNVTTIPVSSSTLANISGTYGATQSAGLTVTPTTLGSVTLNPTSVLGGNSSTGTVVLSSAAPAGGTVVALTSDKITVAQVPGSVTVVAGSTTATFTVTTNPVGANTPVGISGTYGADQLTAVLTVNAPTLSTVSLNPTSVVGGTSAAGTVTLNGVAPAGGAVVTLASNSNAAQVPASVTVARGATTADFNVTTGAVSSSTVATISGIFGATQSAALMVTPPTLASVTLNPTSVLGGTSSAGTVTLTGNAPAGGAVVTLASDKTTAAQVPGSVTVAAGATTTTFNVATSPVGANTTVSILGTYGVAQATTLTVNAASLSTLSVNPTSVAGGNTSTGTVTLNGAAPTGGAIVTLQSSSTAAAQVPPSVTVPAGSTSATFVVTTSAVASNTSSLITGTLGQSQSATLTVTAVTLSALSVNPTLVVGGNSSIGTVTLNSAAPTGGSVVTLQSSNTAAAQVPTSVTVPAGNTSTTFVVTTSAVASNTSSLITGTLGGSQGATLTINAATLSALSLNPTSVVGGSTSTGTVTLNGPAPTSGAVVTLQSSNTAAAQAPTSVTVPAGSTSATFVVTTSTVASNTSSLITGILGGSQGATLTVTAPVSVSLSSMTSSPGSVVGGSRSTGTVTLTGTAPTGGAIVTLQSSNASAVQVPPSVTIAEGVRSATFAITTTPVSTNTSVVISGVYGTTKTANVTVTAATLSSLTRNPTSVVGGTNSTGTVTLNGAAPAGGALVTLQSSNASAAQVPPSVTIAGGARSATFTITTIPVSANTSAVISGVYGLTRTTTLTVNAPTLSSLTRSPSAVVGGSNSSGTLTLSGPSPSGGAVVTLQSSNPSAAQVPASVTIPEGSAGATFTITTSGVASTTSATISAVYGNTKTTSLSVTAASLISLTLNPSAVTGGSTSTATLTLNGAAPPSGAVIRLTSSKTSAAQVPATATVPGGSNSITFTVTTSSVHGTSAMISGTYRGTTRRSTLTVQ